MKKIINSIVYITALVSGLVANAETFSREVEISRGNPRDIYFGFISDGSDYRFDMNVRIRESAIVRLPPSLNWAQSIPGRNIDLSYCDPNRRRLSLVYFVNDDAPASDAFTRVITGNVKGFCELDGYTGSDGDGEHLLDPFILGNFQYNLKGHDNIIIKPGISNVQVNELTKYTAYRSTEAGLVEVDVLWHPYPYINGLNHKLYLDEEEETEVFPGSGVLSSEIYHKSSLPGNFILYGSISDEEDVVEWGLALINVWQIDVLKVPDYIFASAKAYTPIYFKINSEDPVSLDSIRSGMKLDLNYIYEDGSGLVSDTHPIDIENGYLTKITDFPGHVGENVFVCYIDPQSYANLDIPGRNMSNDAFFVLTVTLEDDGDSIELKSLQSDPDARIKKAFVDRDLYAIDMDSSKIGDAKTIRKADEPHAFLESESVRVCETVKMKDADQWNVISTITVQIGPEDDMITLTKYGYWKPIGYRGRREATGLPFWVYDTNVEGEEAVPKFMYTETPYLYPLENPGDVPDDDDFMIKKAFHNVEFSNGFNREFTGPPVAGRGVFSEIKVDQGNEGGFFEHIYHLNNTGLRKGAYFFISYGTKNVTVNSDDGNVTVKYMDLDKYNGSGFLQLSQGGYAISKVNSATNHNIRITADEIVGAYYTIVSAFSPHVGTILGLASATYPLFFEDEDPFDETNEFSGYASVVGYEGYIKPQDWYLENIDHTIDPLDPGSFAVEDGEVDPRIMSIVSEFDNRTYEVGTMIMSFVDVRSNVQISSSPTGKSIQSYAEYIVPTDHVDLFEYKLYSVSE